MPDQPPQFPQGQPPDEPVEPEYIELIKAEPVDAHASHPPQGYTPVQPPQPQYQHPQQPPPQQPPRQRRSYEDMALGALAVFGFTHIKERVTGCIVSVIFVPLFFGFFGWIVFSSMKSSNDSRAQRNEERAAEKLKSEIATTERNLQSASDRVQREARRLHRLPHDDEGSRLMIAMRDGWSGSLQYEIIDQNRYLIRSNGPDGKRNTDDDIVSGKEVSEAVASILKPGVSKHGEQVAAEAAPVFELDQLSAETKPAMTRLVNSTSYNESSESLTELVAMKPVDADRDQVVSVVINYTRELRLASLAAQVVRNWATTQQSHLIADVLLEDSIRGTAATTELLQALIETKSQDALLRLVNHPRDTIADTAMQNVKVWGIDDIALARQHADDLKTLPVASANWSKILERLEALPITEGNLRKEINESLIPLTGENPARLEAIYDILKKTITKDDLEALLVYRSRQNEKQLVSILAEVQDPLAYQTIVEIALDSNEERALTILRADIKSSAESYVWPYLESANFTQRKQAVNLLATIGTSESLSRLEDVAADDRFAGNDAKIAIRLINKRTEAKAAQ